PDANLTPSKFAHVPIRAGDRVHVAISGGGGWGDPARRDPEAVAHDVAEGYISTASAERDYGSGDTTP
ncbi:MAG: hypothetical protein RLO48_01935, partial [Bauldia litoralis]